MKLMNLKNPSLIQLVKCVLIILLILPLFFWIPVIWKNDVVFDKVLFSNEYYKALVDLGKILIGFWLANIFLKRIQKKQLSRMFLNKWNESMEELFSLTDQLEKAENNFSKNEFQALFKEIRKQQSLLKYLIDFTLERTRNVASDWDKIFEAVNIYKNELEEPISLIVCAFEEGSIIPARDYDKEVRKAINDLKAGIQIRQS